MTAIVLNHEQPDQKARGGNGQQQIKPVAEMEREQHQDPKKNERHDRNQNLDNAAAMMWLAIAGKRLQQSAWIGSVSRMSASRFVLRSRFLLQSGCAF